MCVCVYGLRLYSLVSPRDFLGSIVDILLEASQKPPILQVLGGCEPMKAGDVDVPTISVVIYFQ